MQLENLSDDEYNRLYESLKFCMKWEGGYVNDPDDPGGETKWGIAKKYHPEEDIKNLTPERAAEIYLAEYWKPSGAADLPLPECTALLDTAIHCGVARSNQWLRAAKGNIDTYLTLRRNHYLTLAASFPKKKKYLNGWINRLNDLEKYLEIKKGA